MTGSLIFCIALAYFVVGYFVYGGFLKRLMAINPKNPTPANTMMDGIDYVPTPKIVLFGHHFASIAGPGPIVGPIMAAYFGYLPALIWILVGCVFIGAFHDFAALVISIRNKGHSISFVMEKMMGLAGRQLFLSFCLLCLVLVVAIFALLIAGLFASTPQVASASLMFIFVAPVFALVTYKGGVSLRKASFFFVPLVFVIVNLGAVFPFDLGAMLSLDATSVRNIWLVVLALYIFGASVLPVQWLLQPRDYLNSYLLYAMLLLGFLSIVIFNPEIKMEAFKGFEAVTADGKNTALVPSLFIFIACGACSGFHALVASGTTSKQLKNEKDALCVGYGSMLIEGVLGVMALVAVMAMEPDTFTKLGTNPALAFATGIASFSQALGFNEDYAKVFISLAISAFMLTSLDTAARLCRFLLQELFMPRSCKDEKSSCESLGKIRCLFLNKYVASLVIIISSLLLALSGEAGSLWPIFGASNQLMAALTFLVITLWLLARKANFFVALIPMVFMMVMSLWGVVLVVKQQWGYSLLLVIVGIMLIAMAFMMIALGFSIIVNRLKERKSEALADY